MGNMKSCLAAIFQILALALLSSWGFAADGLDQQVKELSAEISALERDVDVLEKNLLFPPLTRVEVYLSLDGRADFTITSATLSLDDQEKSFHIYTAEDVAALHLGGKQHLWEGNVALGKHNLSAVVQGKNAKGQVIEKQAVFQFEKTLAGRSLELAVSVSKDSDSPVLSVKDWGEN